MFPEYRELISRLKSEDAHFNNLFDEHNELDQRIKNMEARIIPGTDTEIENLKKEKLLIKDRLYGVLKDAAVA
ncbi:YdcH family protein [Stutzerimonas stutzeri]